MAIETNGREFEAAVARSVAAKMRVIGQLARGYGLPDPFDGDADRLAQIKASAEPPVSCGPEMIPAPARGPMVRFAPIAVTPVGADGFEVSHVGFRGRDAARAADAFDVMELQARRKAGAAYRPLFSVAQVQAGRRYAELVERHSAVGMRCASAEALAAGSGGGRGDGGYIDAVIHEGDMIRRIEAAIGRGVALAPRRGGGARRAIADLELVQLVCLRGMTLAQVLRARGWVPDRATRAALHGALCGALDRMR
ncbi:hypothetical protein [Rhodobacter capsulatus]|jgi:hypothetical protein|uniref:Uncharacterized protein n=1 Tax=Rhodobacter phage RcapNL TaxID=1131316 RepID=H6WBK4_9CAUD|nr:hypothetical protein [Rhodobacter capsulatus]YP_007518383.1 hypothetical protein I920_gp01 [Rhodobacter phage RcapNL]AFK66508.1 hypothetical protein RHZG_00001 [Rhodobacter phage RcNL1]AFA44841.1 hypothetical protein RcapNL_0001 [Rhodobacter phage RcapNL]ETD02734.1 hypothetical protein U714_04270 [Rhodobacter capsulatus DE442]ETD78891.1 hypothetical protein U717_04275 [Rhodobacter capsulatus R121]ETE54870.1 hypothetical protein U715_04265 [Rhodobacter capsulatus Y262]